MATFRIRQLVRLRYQRTGGNDYVGRRGMVEEIGPFPAGPAPDGMGSFSYPGDYRVRFADGILGQFTADQLDPIVDDGHRTEDWSACLWQPEWFRAWFRA